MQLYLVVFIGGIGMNYTKLVYFGMGMALSTYLLTKDISTLILLCLEIAWLIIFDKGKI